MGVTVWDSKELQAAILALKVVGKDLRREILKRQRELILPEWREAIGEEISGKGGDIYGTRLSAKNTRIKLSTQGFTLVAATLNKKTTSGGLIPSKHYYLAEFGAAPKVVPVQGRRGDTRYEYKRKVNTGFSRRVSSKEGRFAFKAGRKMLNRALALYTQSAIQLVYEAFERKN